MTGGIEPTFSSQGDRGQTVRRLLAVLYYVTVMAVFSWSFASGQLSEAFDYYKVMAFNMLCMACCILLNGGPRAGSRSKKVSGPLCSPTGGTWDKELDG